MSVLAIVVVLSGAPRLPLPPLRSNAATAKDAIAILRSHGLIVRPAKEYWRELFPEQLASGAISEPDDNAYFLGPKVEFERLEKSKEQSDALRAKCDAARSVLPLLDLETFVVERDKFNADLLTLHRLHRELIGRAEFMLLTIDRCKSVQEATAIAVQVNGIACRQLVVTVGAKKNVPFVREVLGGR